MKQKVGMARDPILHRPPGKFLRIKTVSCASTYTKKCVTMDKI